MKYPDREKVREYLAEGMERNPGAWVHHSEEVGQIASRMAEALGLDPEFAYAYGALHDIGRREGFKYKQHLYDGYAFLVEEGYPQVAKACLTHSFPIKDFDLWGAVDDMDEKSDRIARQVFASLEYNEYDRIVQLLDSTVTGEGAVLQEVRMVDTALRYGVDEITLKNWRALIDLRKELEEKLKTSIYDFMPGALERSIGKED